MLFVLTSRERVVLTQEGRRLKKRITDLGVPRMWGKTPRELLDDVRDWQHRCLKAGLIAAPVFSRLGDDIEHTSAAEVMLSVDETLMALSPPRMVGG